MRLADNGSREVDFGKFGILRKSEVGIEDSGDLVIHDVGGKRACTLLTLSGSVSRHTRDAQDLPFSI